MRKILSRRRALTLAALACVAAVPAFARGEEIVAVTSDGRVITFDSAAPGILTGNQVLSGVTGSIVAIDVRPADGVLYAVTDGARLYRVDVATGAAIEVGAGPFAAALGTAADMDFSPTADQIRIVNDANRNLRVDPISGSLIDGDLVQSGVQEDARLAFDTTDVNAGVDPTVVALASDAAGDVFGIDTTRDALVAIIPPAGGTLHTVGPLGVGIRSPASFDVSATTSAAFAALTLQGQFRSGLYNVNLATGGVTLAGDIGYPSTVVAMAIGPTTAIPAPLNQSLVGLTPAGELVSFQSDAPATITSRVTVTGILAGDSLVAIDTRQSDGRLYGLGSAGRIYVINTVTGLATPIRAAPFEVPLAGTSFGFDFNAPTSRIRIVSDQGQNLRVDPDTGAVVDGDPSTPGTQADTPLSFAPSDVNHGATPNVFEAAFDLDASTASPATFFVIDSNLGVLARVGSEGGTTQSANSGVLHTIGSLGVDAAGVMGFEIVGDSTAFASFRAPDGAAGLYSIDLTTGAATFIDGIGVAETLRDLAAAPTSQPPAPGADLSVQTLVIHLNYARSGHDSLSLDGAVPFPAGALEGQVVRIDVGGFAKEFTLSRVGKAKDDGATRSRLDDDTFAFAARPHDGRLRFSTRLRREDMAADLTDEGMGPTETVHHADRTVEVTITVNGTTFAVPVALHFTAKAGRTGLANSTGR